MTPITPSAKRKLRVSVEERTDDLAECEISVRRSYAKLCKPGSKAAKTASFGVDGFIQ